MYCSVKFLEPTVMVGPLPPEPSVPPTLPHATMSSSARQVSSAGTARLNLVVFFISPPVSFVPSFTCSLRDLESLWGERSFQRAETDFRDDREDCDGDGSGEQDLRTAALQTLDDQIP